MKPDFSKGLVPAIIVEESTKEVLMLAYMNEESFQKTLATKTTWFYSRSRQSLWNKGETSGHFQKVKEIVTDCDKDTLLITVEQIGPACHTGAHSCFLMKFWRGKRMINTLYQEILERQKEPKAGSYTNYLFDKGLDKILKKVGEETTEVIIAAKNSTPEELISETADLVYHMLVLLAEKEIPLEAIRQELAKREGKLSKTEDRKEIERL